MKDLGARGKIASRDQFLRVCRDVGKTLISSYFSMNSDDGEVSYELVFATQRFCIVFSALARKR